MAFFLDNTPLNAIHILKLLSLSSQIRQILANNENLYISIH